MSFAQLARFIENALERLSDPSVPDDGELPRSQEELLTLCDMLPEKAAAEKKAVPIPQPPNYKGPENPKSFAPSDKLLSLYAKRDRLQQRADESYWDDDKLLHEWDVDQVSGSLLLMDIEVESSARKHTLKQRF